MPAIRAVQGDCETVSGVVDSIAGTQMQHAGYFIKWYPIHELRIQIL